MNNDKFKKGSGCFKCEECGKLTRDTMGYDAPYCADCIHQMEKENYESDHDIKEGEGND